MIYRSYDACAADIRRWLRHVPEIAAVAGIPRSGVFAATVIAQERHIPLVSLSGDDGRPPSSRELRAIRGPLLVVDDTCWNGRALGEARALLGASLAPPRSPLHAHPVWWAAVYAHPRAHDWLDLFGYSTQDGCHTFAWNLFCDPVAAVAATDLDGVLAAEGPGAPTGRAALPLQPARRKLAAIVTGRPERQRAATTVWLARHEIEYRELHMLPNGQPTGWANVARFKGAVFRRLHAAKRVSFYVESDARQARWIANGTRLPVLHYGAPRGINETPLKPSWEFAR